jgi:hypothetical protein
MVSRAHLRTRSILSLRKTGGGQVHQQRQSLPSRGDYPIM